MQALVHDICPTNTRDGGFFDEAGHLHSMCARRSDHTTLPTVTRQSFDIPLRAIPSHQPADMHTLLMEHVADIT
jgi:hypothetical protein